MASRITVPSKTPFRGFALVLFLSVFAACAPVPPAKTAGNLPGAALLEMEKKTWEEGLHAFRQGDYSGAGITFEVLTRTAQSNEIRRKALYGLAATRLTMARTLEEYADAVSIWEQWGGQTGSDTGAEDPRMLTPFLLRFPASGGLPSAKSDAPTDQARKAAKDAGSNYKNMLQSREREVESLRAKLEAREREVRRLRHQLESLEEIHRKYQEKKQGGTAP